MRIIREFPFSERIKASLFSWNGKYILKLESGNLEQTYKIPETEISGIDELEEWYSSPDFKASAEDVFIRMAGSAL
jgi:hypothetical protein